MTQEENWLIFQIRSKIYSFSHYNLIVPIISHGQYESHVTRKIGLLFEESFRTESCVRDTRIDGFILRIFSHQQPSLSSSSNYQKTFSCLFPHPGEIWESFLMRLSRNLTSGKFHMAISSLVTLSTKRIGKAHSEKGGLSSDFSFEYEQASQRIRQVIH